LEHEEYARMFEAERAQWWYEGMRAIQGALLAGPLGSPAGSVRPLLLDAGCGTGYNLHHLSSLARPIGVDLSAEALRFCQERGVAVARGNLLALPFQAQRFDCVTSFDVLYHAWVTDDRAATRELCRVLRPGGYLLLRVPALRMLWGAHDRAVHSRHRYTRGEVRRLLEQVGMSVLRLSYCNSLLFPLLAVRRGLDRLTGRQGSDVQFLPGPLEWAFRRALVFEAALLRRGFSLPIGASVVTLARKPA
jgi:SAM-dependent methyltransferase